MSEGKFEDLIKRKRGFLRQAKTDYASGGNDMLDDVEAALSEAKAELAHNLELTSCLREENEAAYQRERLAMFEAWYAKWFGGA
ncbi:MAG: hypothetical protein NWE93_11955 [Candidatus Bathyarchaeota archaeon]|nr:hypothetical protein [Candidatus Bathyarchaeota archaeon]